ncbi:hypothetical protein [Scatolibacter rhodanostii]|uniref:hypothetical protein n=1 Tax=Scatolibacter rhodanostii TaxID=2014781 RepID=UPI000C083FFC|nr:hypothetical protein [Scatolibacter rhodanostii]
MKTRTLKKSCILPSTQENIFNKLQSIKTLQYIAFPYATFSPVDVPDNLEWKAGQVFTFQLKMMGLVPFGLHEIRVSLFDENSYEIYTNENNPHVPIWNHRISLEAIADNLVRYTDEVEINAGWKTIFVYLWAKCFYAHRQRKWKKLLNR